MLTSQLLNPNTADLRYMLDMFFHSWAGFHIATTPTSVVPNALLYVEHHFLHLSGSIPHFTSSDCTSLQPQQTVVRGTRTSPSVPAYTLELFQNLTA